jgi:putative acyl-CoA dehydrogenase
MTREPDSTEALLVELEASRGANASLDSAIDSVKDKLAHPRGESMARNLVESMALALQGAVLVRSVPPAISDAFCATRLGERPAMSYGAFDAKIDVDAILARTMPKI